MLKRILLYPLIILIAVICGTVGWLNALSPLSALPPPEHDLEARRTGPMTADGRHLEHITLAGDELGDIGIVISLPDPLPKEKLPVLIVLGGLGTGEDNIREIKNPGANAIVGYDWPIPVAFPGGKDFLRQTPDLYRDVMSIPGQIASAIGWLAAQPWADDRRISILGFSLGALAAPAVENLAEHDGHEIGWTVIAYGGAPLGDLFAANPHIKPLALRLAAGPIIDLLLHPLEPTVNLPQCSSHFLVLEGRDDTLIPKPDRDNLRNAVPEPKDVIFFSGDHMGVGPDREILLDEITRESRSWLVRNGAVNGT
jgi:dienelactone hydrolase